MCTTSRSSGPVPSKTRSSARSRPSAAQPVNAHDSSARRRGFDTVSHSADVVFGRLTHHLKGGDILLLHDGHAARTRTGLPVILEVLPRLLETMAAAKLTPITLRAALDLQ